jgi:hypothetical protein
LNIVSHLNYDVKIIEKNEIIDDYDVKMPSMTAPILEYENNKGNIELFSGFYTIIRFMGRLTHLFPSNIGYAAMIDSYVDFHSIFMNLYFNDPASVTPFIKNLLYNIDGKNMFLSKMDNYSIADILWAVTFRETNIVAESNKLLKKMEFYNENILGVNEEKNSESEECLDEYDTETSGSEEEIEIESD